MPGLGENSHHITTPSNLTATCRHWLTWAHKNHEPERCSGAVVGIPTCTWLVANHHKPGGLQTDQHPFKQPSGSHEAVMFPGGAQHAQVHPALVAVAHPKVKINEYVHIDKISSIFAYAHMGAHMRVYARTDQNRRPPTSSRRNGTATLTQPTAMLNTTPC
jgi:hypothetical protein